MTNIFTFSSVKAFNRNCCQIEIPSSVVKVQPSVSQTMHKLSPRLKMHV